MLLIPVAVAYLWLVAQAPPVPPPPPRQYGQARDPRPTPEAAGTATVRGRVVTSDGRPVKRVMVTLNQAMTSDQNADQINRGVNPRPVSRTAMTDAQGQFVFEGLPPGLYRLGARPGPFQAQFLTGGFGQTRPGQASLPPAFELSDGQQLTAATIVLPRGGAITGRVTDDEGEPVSRVPVAVLFFAPGASGPTRSAGAETDDQGRFRVYGLQPGDYLLIADVRGANRFGGDSDADPTGFMTTYYPGVPSVVEAQRIQVQTGGETSGIDFRLLRGRLFTIAGAVVNSQGQPSDQIGVTISQSNLPGEVLTSNQVETDAKGQFEIRNLAPGRYKLFVRPRMRPGMGTRGNARSAADAGEFANLDLQVDSDIRDLLITTHAALSVSGRVVFSDGLPPTPAGGADPVQQLRVSATPPPGSGWMGAGRPANVQVSQDLTFTLSGLTSAMVIRVSGLPRNFVVKQVLVGSDDITDRAHEFTDRDSGNLQIVVTSRVAGIEGSVADAAGKPAADSVVVLLTEPENGEHATTYRTGSVDPQGRFTLQALRSGRFVVIAIPRDRMPRPNDTEALDALAKEGQSIAIGDGEFKVLDLRLSGGE